MWVALRERHDNQRNQQSSKQQLFVRFVTMISLLLACLSPGVSLISAQQTTNEPPLYRLTAGINVAGNDDALEVNVGIINAGGAAEEDTRVEVVAIDSADEVRVVVTEELRALGSNNDREAFIMRVPFSEFEPGSRQVFQVRIVGLSDQPDITSSPLSFLIPIPTPTVPPSASASPFVSTPPAVTTPPSVIAPPVLRIPALNIAIDLNNREQVALMLTVVACVLFLLLLIIRLLRLLFARRPDFKIPWQPPYATLPPLDPYSASGVRQAWQPLAQNNLISSPPAQGALQSIKLLLGTDGRYLSGWQVTAVRMIQYDQYGRVNRSETLLSQEGVKRLNGLLRNNQRLNAAQMLRRVRPIANTLIKSFRRRVTSRSAMLPVALDIRLKGKHGEVNIVFELFRFDQGFWQLIDRWQPEMIIVSKHVQENYTYSIYGQAGGETMRTFYRRLTEDLTRTLADFVGSKPEQPPEAGFVEPPPETGAPAPVTTQGERVPPQPAVSDDYPVTDL
jgi:hypothetical protein